MTIVREVIPISILESSGVREFLNPAGLVVVPALSNVVKVGQFVFISAQVSNTPQQGIVAKGDPEGQVRQIWSNLAIAMEAAGGTIRDIVATWTCITNVEHMPFVSKVREELFPTNPPTSSRPLVVNQLTTTPDMLVSISAFAILRTAP
ncbi:MAG: endoribonuclease [Myxococcales bacterium]|nr:endoribonuclease [Myxococcales bacterium]